MMPCAILQTLMELIFRYEKTALLKQECRKHFKVTLIPSSYSLTSGRCISKRPHLLTQQLNTRSYLFQSSYFFAKILFSTNGHHISTQEKHTINQKHHQKFLLMSILRKRREIAWRSLFCNFKMSLFKLKSPGFF